METMKLPSEHCELIELATAGDQQALADVFEQFRERLERVVSLRMDHRLQGRFDVSDVLQEAFMDASRRLQEYVAEPQVTLFVWLRSLAMQRLIDLHRRHLGARCEALPGRCHSAFPATRQYHPNRLRNSSSIRRVPQLPKPRAPSCRVESKRLLTPWMQSTGKCWR